MEAAFETLCSERGSICTTCERNRVERFFHIIKHFRAIATRSEKTARTFLAGVHLVCALALLK